MSSIIDDEQCVFRIMSRDHIRDLYSEGELGVVGRDWKNFRLVHVPLSKALVQIVQLWHNPQIIALPVQQKDLGLAVPLQ